SRRATAPLPSHLLPLWFIIVCRIGAEEDGKGAEENAMLNVIDSKKKKKKRSYEFTFIVLFVGLPQQSVGLLYEIDVQSEEDISTRIAVAAAKVLENPGVFERVHKYLH
ncbi:hypothetical protein AVEN_253603-2-1, partial [Araneus ventricosus]